MQIAGIIVNDVINGEGVCVSIYFQGCPHHCKGCFNPETWSPDGGNYIDSIDLIKQVKQLLIKNDIHRNLSFLGGEPFYNDNVVALEAIINSVKQDYPNIKIFIWTGYKYENLLKNDHIKNILKKIDVLIDGQYIEEERDITLKWRGSRNQRVIDVQKSLKTKEVKLYIA